MSINKPICRICGSRDAVYHIDTEKSTLKQHVYFLCKNCNHKYDYTIDYTIDDYEIKKYLTDDVKNTETISKALETNNGKSFSDSSTYVDEQGNIKPYYPFRFTTSYPLESNITFNFNPNDIKYHLEPLTEKPLIIKKTLNADSRTIPEGTIVSEIDVLADTIHHIYGVKGAVDILIERLRTQTLQHDHTKISKLSDFTRELNLANEYKLDFATLPWYKTHTVEERHHLNSHCPDDVNLLDVLEMIADGVCAGLARTGEVYPINISDDILQKAIYNTVELLKKSIVAVD